jgi:hypothetical protein
MRGKKRHINSFRFVIQMSSDPYATTSTVKNIVQHVISPKIVNDGSGGYVTKTDLVNIDNAVLSGDVTSATTTAKSIVINSPSATATDITLNVNSSTNWTVSHDASTLFVNRHPNTGPLESALSINRSTGQVNIPGQLTVTQNTTVLTNFQADTVTTNTSTTFGTATVGTLTATANINCSQNLGFGSAGRIQFPNGGRIEFPTNGSTMISTGSLNVQGNFTFGTNSSSTIGYALFNNAQAGIISWTGNSVGTTTVTGLNSSSIVTVTARNSGSLYGGGNFSVDTNTVDTLKVFTQNSGSYAFNYFVSRF